MKHNNFEYDSDLDVLYIYNNESGEDVLGSVGFGNFVYDVGNSGKIVGLEIDNASRVFQTTPQLLQNVANATLHVSLQGAMLLIAFAISLNNKEYNFSYVIPQKKIAITS